MDEIKAKQQVVEKIKEAGKILVTVSDDPSVDALSAALALTLILDKQEKYATAIFSGETPPAIAFLEPQKTFDDTTDSLRDFIIALNKEKADHLRYKVEGDSVKIFITPYKTTINQDDLEYSQGDYNVELVIALGVDKQENLDKALENHGQILHDATIVTLSAGDQTSDLGGIDWHDDGASSLSEMVTGLAEALKSDKKKSLLDTPIATALLTGLVAQTDRFSNEHTTSKAMTVAATLMASGADQQLIATELQRAQLIVDDVQPEVAEQTQSDEPQDEQHDDAPDQPQQGYVDVQKDPSRLSITHDTETLAQMDKRVLGEDGAKEKIEDEIDAIEQQAEEEAEKREKEAIQQATPTVNETFNPQPYVEPAPVVDTETADAIDEPTFGGVLNATADQAQEDARRAAEDDQNKTILSHAYIGDPQATQDGSAMITEQQGFPGTPAAAPGSVGFTEVPTDDTVHSAYAAEDETPAGEQNDSLAIGAERVIQPLTHSTVIEPVSAYAPEPAFDTPAQPVADFGLPLPPPIPDFSQGLSAAIPTGPTGVPQPGILGDILAPEPVAPLDPPTALGFDYEATDPVSAPSSAYAFEAPAAPEVPAAAYAPAPQVPSDAYASVEDQLVQPEPVSAAELAPALTPPAPGQFQIPGQQ